MQYGGINIVWLLPKSLWIWHGFEISYKIET